MLSIENSGIPSFTSVPNAFIKKYFPVAPATYINLFIYLLMLSQKKEELSGLEKICRTSAMSESEITAALNYWENKGLLVISRHFDVITGINLNLKPLLSEDEEHRLSPSEVKTLAENNNDTQMSFYIADKYLGHPLSNFEIGTLSYIIDELDFSFELFEYLLDYCVSKGHRSIRYIERIALSWHEKGIRSVEEAKEYASEWSKIHFKVLKAFGISNRNPTKKECEYIDKWYKTYCFSLDIISEACQKTLMNTGRQRFDYADSILKKWHEAGVKTLSEIKALDNSYKPQSSAGTKKPNKNSFHNYEQRDDDMDALERRLKKQFAGITEDKNAPD